VTGCWRSGAYPGEIYNYWCSLDRFWQNMDLRPAAAD
jgi:hypothetical protein